MNYSPARPNRRFRLSALLLGCWFALVTATIGIAQEPAAPPAAPGSAPAAPQAPTAGGGAVVLEQDTSGHYFEWVLTVIGVGIALFVVCRSSRRN